MAESVKRKFVSGITWTLVQNLSVKALDVVITVVLARLLLPEDYGLIGMLSIFIAISDVFIQSGFGQALIQKSNCTDEDFSTAFYFNVTVSVIIYLILFIAAPAIASFYHEPQLVVVTRVLSLNFVLGSLNIVQQSKLRKAMNFKPLAIITLACTFFSGIIGILLAFWGFGVWALVAQALSSTLLRVVLFPLFTRWTPNTAFSRDSFRQLWGFGSKIMVSGILDVVIINLSNILIGRYYNKEQVGYFSKARRMADIPAMTMSSVLGTVLYPLLSKIHEDESRHIAIYKKVSKYAVTFSFPILILLSLLAEPIVLILFTEKWAASIPLLRILLLARVFLTLNVINANMLQSRGDAKLYMYLYFIAGPICLIATAMAIPFGVEAIAWATFISGFLYYLIFAVVVGRKIGYSFWRQLWDWREIFVSLILMSVLVLLSTHWFCGQWTKLIVGSIVGVAVYTICCFVFKLIDDDMIQTIKSMIKRSNK